jgi:hypothetical protein
MKVETKISAVTERRRVLSLGIKIRNENSKADFAIGSPEKISALLCSLIDFRRN